MKSYYKMKDIVDFDNNLLYEKRIDNHIIKYIDKATGEEIPCEVCKCHREAYNKFQSVTTDYRDIGAQCPKCGDSLIIYDDNVVVGEVNEYCPEDPIGYFPLCKCESCKEYYALVPEHIIYNANHDIYYTGGKWYVDDEDTEKLIKNINDEIGKNIKQYVKRKIENHDTTLVDWCLDSWNAASIERIIAEFMYKKGYKK